MNDLANKRELSAEDRPAASNAEALPHVAFYLYHFNDIDQSTPIMWKFLERGHKVTTVLLDPQLSHDNDPRFRLLKTYPGFDIKSVTDVIPVPGAGWLFRQKNGMTTGRLRRLLRKVLRETGLTVQMAETGIRAIGAKVCVFEWGGLGARNRTECLLAAQRLGLRTATVPQGANIFLNVEVNKTVAEAVRRGEKPRQDYNAYDAYIFQNPIHRDAQVKLGMDPDMCRVIGSPRYCQEWLAIHDTLYPPFQPKHDCADKTKLVFVLQQWIYNIDQEATLAAIQRLYEQDWIYLIVKDHPRSDLGALPKDLRAKIAERTNAEVIGAEVSSTSLMNWSDAVINFASSIAIEPIVKGKPVINPRYLHANATAFDDPGVTICVNSDAELIDAAGRLRTEKMDGLSGPARDNFLQTVVHGGHNPVDVLQGYYDVIVGNQNEQQYR